MKIHIRYLLGLAVAIALLASSTTPAQAFIGLSIGIAPPPLPVYAQPSCPGYGYIWTPGYWAWDGDDNDYYWVPGTWALAPAYGLLWTPGWWGCNSGAYYFHPGYWGQNVGFYGGVAYGYGYEGRGYDGGYWRGNHFYYNREANNLGNIRNGYVYDRSVNTSASRVSFNGGTNGNRATATAAERNAFSQRRYGATSAQTSLARSAAADPSQRFSVNHGRPAVTGTTRAAAFHRATTSPTAASHATALTGEQRTASAENSANGPSPQVQETSSEHHAGEGSAFHSAEAQPHFSQSHSFSMSSHASSSHSSGGGGSFAHASVSHSSGGGGGSHSSGGGAGHGSSGGGGDHH